MRQPDIEKPSSMSRRGFLQAVGGTAAAVSLSSARLNAGAPRNKANPGRPAKVRCAFLYPPTESLRRVGYYSWPGSSFDAEGRQKQYEAGLRTIEQRLGMKILTEGPVLDRASDVAAFVAEVKKSRPDGLLLVPFKKGHWPHVLRIIEQTELPTVILATLGILLVDHINQVREHPGVYLINSLDNLDAVEDGMNMIRTGRWMKESRILNIAGSQERESTVPHLGTRIRTVPLAGFVEQFNSTETDDAVRKLADSYMKNAQEIVQPKRADILDAAKTYFVLKKMIRAENAQAVMMDCLPGLKRPHKHPPPCMGFMSLRDEGIPAGCQADLRATLSLMLVQQLFDRPGFQQNASMETEANHYFGAHCTCASKLRGTGAASEPYVLMSHAEAGWGCVPRVLWPVGEQVTMAQYVNAEMPQMYVYSGKVVGCPPIPATGGCRTNIQMTINEVEDVCRVKGMHQVIFLGNHARQLKAFCRLHRITVVT